MADAASLRPVPSDASLGTQVYPNSVSDLLDETLIDVYTLCTLRGLSWTSLCGFQELIELGKIKYSDPNCSVKLARSILDLACSHQTRHDFDYLSQWRGEPALVPAFDRIEEMFRSIITQSMTGYIEAVDQFIREKDGRFHLRLDRLADIDLELQLSELDPVWPGQELLFDRLRNWFGHTQHVLPPQPAYSKRVVHFNGDNSIRLVTRCLPPSYVDEVSHDKSVESSIANLAKVVFDYGEIREMVRRADARLRSRRNRPGVVVPQHLSANPSLAKGGVGQTPKRQGRTPLRESRRPQDQARLIIYQIVRSLKATNPDWGKTEMRDHFQNNKDFKDSLNDAGMKFELKMFHAALEWIKANPELDHVT